MLFLVIHGEFNWNDHVERVIGGVNIGEYFRELESGSKTRRIELGFGEDEKQYCYLGISADNAFLYYYCPVLIDQADVVSALTSANYRSADDSGRTWLIGHLRRFAAREDASGL